MNQHPGIPQPRRRLIALAVLTASFVGGHAVGADSPSPGRAALIEQVPNAFFPLTPCRLIDTRQPIGDGSNRTTPLRAGETATETVVGTNGECIVPDSANAVSLNVTALGGTATSFLTVFPSDAQSTPLASNLNWTPGAPPTPNKVDVDLSDDGEMSLFNAFGQVDVIVDVAGYYSSAELNETSARTVRLERALPTAVSSTRAAASVDGSTPIKTPITNVVVDELGGTAVVTYNLSYIGVGTWPETLECDLVDASPRGLTQQRGGVSGSQVLHLGDSAVIELSADESTDIGLTCGPVSGVANSSVLVTDVELAVLVLPRLSDGS